MTSEWLRPFGVILNGKLHFGLEVAVVEGVVQEIRSSTSPSEPWILSPAFVNAHSHLEYRGMLDQITHPEYYEWIYELTRLKPLETPDFVRVMCDLAAAENRATGVAWIGEHSDRPGSVEAMQKHGLGGWVFHEVLTTGSPDVWAKLESVNQRLEETVAQLRLVTRRDTSSDGEVGESSNRVRRLSEANNELNIQGSLNPHAYYTVDREVLKQLGANGHPSSIHLAETVHESNFTRTGTGPLADRRRSFGVPFDIYEQSVVEVLDSLGVLRPGMQCVHCCDVDTNDIEILASRGVTIAHCPRSNIRLQCPTAPVREMLDAGIKIGLGMDSPASGGKIDMFAEMRAVSPTVRPDEIWRMATNMGYQSFGNPSRDWDIAEGSSVPLIAIKGEFSSVEEAIALGSPERIRWIA